MTSIYIHYPFCKSKCPYCDFNSHVQKEVNQQNYLNAYLSELDFYFSKTKERQIKTIFFGGGTPSLMPINLVEKILNKISQNWQICDNVEITLEANPTSFESEKFKNFKSAGINRLSLGIQSLNDDDLKFLGREHSSKEAISTIKNVQKIFDNFSFDLIYALPNQSLNSWKKELEKALEFSSPHISLYQLTIEKGTRFFSDFSKGKFTMPNEELAANFYEFTNEILENNNFNQYEISNYANISKEKDFRSQHNLAYWQNSDYIGIGAGAHGRIFFNENNLRTAIMNIHHPDSWIKKVEENNNGIQKFTKISKLELAQEIILMGLRIEEGVSKKIFSDYLNLSFDKVFKWEFLENLQKNNLLEISETHIKIPKKSWLLTNSIIQKIIENIKI
jgi:oxygen-independent coproporphyrinogen-3 oxidase